MRPETKGFIMSYIKAYNTEVAIEVGIQASLILNYVKWWVENKNVDKVFRTNKQVSEDFDGTISESQVQRAKKKLVESGFIVVSHDKGHTRTTHYSLTEKAKTMLGLIKSAVDAVKKVVKKVIVKPSKKQSSMEESFESQGSVAHAVPIPTDCLQKLSGLLKQDKDVVDPDIDNDSEYDEDGSDDDDYFKAIDAGLESCSSKVEDLSLSEIMDRAFSKIPNVDILEANRYNNEQSRLFKEDY